MVVRLEIAIQVLQARFFELNQAIKELYFKSPGDGR